MTIPKRHHWVPRFYLRRFAIPNPNRRAEQVWIYHRKEGEPKRTSINNIAVEKFLYSPEDEDGRRDPRLERKLADLEGSLSRLWPELASGFPSLEREGVRKGLSLFLSIQLLRHPAQRGWTRAFRKQLVDVLERQPRDGNGNPDVSHLQIGSHDYPVDTSNWQSYRDAGPELDEQLWLDSIERNANVNAEMLMAKRWSIVFIDKPLFVTSDYPVFVPQPELSRYQIGGKNAYVMFPISPTRILWMDDLDAPPNQCCHVENDQADVYNSFTWVNTDSFLISPRDIYGVLKGICRVRAEFESEIPGDDPRTGD